MNIINVKVNFKNGTCETTGINLITGDYNSTKMVFTFDREDGTKVFEMKSPSDQLVMVQEIQNNEIILYGLDKNENIASIFTEEGKYIFEVSLYESESKLTSAKGQIKVKPEQVVIDGEVVEAYLPIFDQLLTQVNTAITQTNNLNITGSKAGTTTTIVITKKDGTAESVQVLDGEKGEKGDKGDSGSIKFIIVETLPSENIDESAIYLTPSENPDLKNHYDEWIWVVDRFEPLGETQIEVDLTDYVKNTDLQNTIDTSLIPVTKISGTFQNPIDLRTLNEGNYLLSGSIIIEDRSYLTTGGGAYASYNFPQFLASVNIDTSGEIPVKTIVSERGNFIYTYENNAWVLQENVAYMGIDEVYEYVDYVVGDIGTLLDDLDTGSGV